MRCAALLVAAAAGLGAQTWTDAQVAAALAPHDHVLLLDRGDGVSRWTRGLEATDAFLPCSTFKLPHALVALETGVVGPGRERRRCDPAECHGAHGDLGLAAAIGVSCISYFRQTARAIGTPRMAAGLARLGYPGTGPLEPLDGFWLTGGLRITAEQQLAWIRRFYTGVLPVEAEHLAAVRAASRRDPGKGYCLEGKTGASREGLGWFVGQITRSGRPAWVVVLLRGGGATGTEAERRLRLLLEGASW